MCGGRGIPADVAGRVAEVAHGVWAEEAELIGYYRSESFSLAEVGRRMGIDDA